MVARRRTNLFIPHIFKLGTRNFQLGYAFSEPRIILDNDSKLYLTANQFRAACEVDTWDEARHILEGIEYAEF
jgi:hypothetical protein